MPRNVNILAMAGDGQRFKDAGILTPKPMILVAGEPMFLRAARSLPEASQWVFICREEHIRETRLPEIIETNFPGAIVHCLSAPTRGQADTCLLSEQYLFPDDIVLFGACDSCFDLNKDAYVKAFEHIDLTIFTTSPTDLMLENPNAYGWVSRNKDGHIRTITCKRIASDAPSDDQVIVGAFRFNNASEFISLAHNTIENNHLVRGEYYMDTLAEQALDQGYRVNFLEVEKYISFGTPEELQKCSGMNSQKNNE